VKKVLVNKPIHADALKRLSEEVEVLTPFTSPATEVISMLEEVHGLILCAGLNITAEVMDRFQSMQVIGRHGAGLDFVDVQAATERGIPLVYTPDGPTESTAEHAFLLMLAAARKLSLLDRATRAGNFHVRDQVVGRELKGARVGVVGFGRIGKRFAEMCRLALEAPIYVYDPWVEENSVVAWGATYMRDLVALAEMVDVLSIHCPSMPETRHLVDREVLQALGPAGYLVNASRGPIVDEEALVKALQQDQLAGAGLDVYDPEPPAPDNLLFELDNVVLTPHLASFTDEGRRRMGMTVVEDVLRVLRGEAPVYLANPPVLSNYKTIQRRSSP
jgi:D-3-phosphoglycerate dehydrogenase